MMPGENENILIRVVDDDAHMRGSLEFMLTAEGFAVKTYPSAQAALKSGSVITARASTLKHSPNSAAA